MDGSGYKYEDIVINTRIIWGCLTVSISVSYFIFYGVHQIVLHLSVDSLSAVWRVGKRRRAVPHVAGSKKYGKGLSSSTDFLSLISRKPIIIYQFLFSVRSSKNLKAPCQGKFEAAWSYCGKVGPC